jgi:hypothetical protein
MSLVLEQLETAIHLDPSYGPAWLTKGAILFLMERNDEAIAASVVPERTEGDGNVDAINGALTIHCRH